VTAEPFRLPAGGAIDRTRTLAFTFDGRAYSGHPGDTLASALLANGVRLVGRSFKYHRPRGIFTAGPEEPNALVRVGGRARAEPNTRATMVELYDGLVAASQNRWPSLGLDVWALNDLFAPLFPAGFYYKTFMAPARGPPTSASSAAPPASAPTCRTRIPTVTTAALPIATCWWWAAALPGSWRRARRRAPAPM